MTGSPFRLEGITIAIQFRSRRLRQITLILLASVSVATIPRVCHSQSPSQTPATQSEAQHKISINSDLVVLPVTVKDRNGNLVAGLEQTDFRVLDDDLEQSVDVFTSEASPLSLVLLIDDDLKAKDADQMAPSLRAIAAGVSLADEAMVCRFDLLFYAGDAFTADGDQLLSDLRKGTESKRAISGRAGPFCYSTLDTYSHKRGTPYRGSN